MGKPGYGQHTKMGNQIAIANNMLGVVESLIYAHKSGLDVEHFLNTIKTGAAGSKALEGMPIHILFVFIIWIFN